MNLEKFSGPGSTPNRRAFWDKIVDVVLASQKRPGKNITVDEREGYGSVINQAPGVGETGEVGACCSDNGAGSCSVTTQAACESGGGVWLGPGTDCDPDPCPVCCRPFDAPNSAIMTISGGGTTDGSPCSSGNTIDFTWAGETKTIPLDECESGECHTAWSGECEVSGGYPCNDDDAYVIGCTPSGCEGSCSIRLVWGFTLYHNVPCQPDGWSYIVTVAIGVNSPDCTSCGNQFFGDPQVPTGGSAPPSCSAIAFGGPTGTVTGTATAADYPGVSFPYSIEFSSETGECACFSA